MNLQELSREVGEQVAGRPGGAVSLAVGFAQIFAAVPGMRSLMSYWYHFAIMFEALFILTTIDTGTRVSRFLVQEFVGRVWPRFERTDWLPGTIISTAVVVFAWAYFIWTGSISTIWPMFGTANQLLAGVALAVATSAIINAGRARYVWVTLIPMLFVTVTTLTAGWLNITDNFYPLASHPDDCGAGLDQHHSHFRHDVLRGDCADRSFSPLVSCAGQRAVFGGRKRNQHRRSQL